jgi:hypothetical protein
MTLFNLSTNTVNILQCYNSIASCTEITLLIRKREFEVNRSTCQSLVYLLVGIKSVVYTSTFLLVQNDLKDLTAILTLEDSSTDNLDWVNKVGHDGFVDRLECARSWALLLLGCTASVGALWSWEDTAGCHNDYVAIRELLLKFAGQSRNLMSTIRADEQEKALPLLNLVP